MARLMSVAYTESQVRDRTKYVTRRLGWAYLRPGDKLTLCRKVMGRRRGEPLVRVAAVQVISVRREPLDTMLRHRYYGLRECDLEGFPDLNPETFIDRYFVAAQGVTLDAVVTRVEFAYLCGHHREDGRVCGLAVAHLMEHGAWQ